MKNTLKQVGRTDVKVVTYDTSLDVTTSIAKGNEPLVAASAAPWTYADWAGADMLGRLKAGVKLWPGAAALPSTLLTVKNAKNYLPPKTSDPTPPGNWRVSFLKLWVKG